MTFPTAGQPCSGAGRDLDAAAGTASVDYVLTRS